MAETSWSVIIAAFAIGLSIGFFLAFFIQDRRIQTARLERDRAIDMPNIMARRAPVTAVVRADIEKQEARERQVMKGDAAIFGELMSDEVGDEPVDERTVRAPAGIDPRVLEG